MNTLRIYIVGVGGQGNVLASKMIGEAALSMGVPVLMSETHGMAQRGGVVESTVVLGGAQSPTISDNCADILLAFEPMEAVRALSKANADTIVITNTAPVVPFIPGGSAAYPPVDDLLACLRAKVGRVIAFDARKESLEAGNPLGLSPLVLGAGGVEAAGDGGDGALVEPRHQGGDGGAIDAAREEQAVGHVRALVHPNAVLQYAVEAA